MGSIARKPVKIKPVEGKQAGSSADIQISRIIFPFVTTVCAEFDIVALA